MTSTSRPESATDVPLPPLVGGALDQLVEGVGVFDAELKLIYCNQLFRTLRDYPETLCKTGVHLSEFHRHNALRGDYGDVAIEKEVERRTARAKSGEAFEFDLQITDNAILHVRYQHISAGGLLYTFEDVTEKRQIEESLRRSEERYDLIAEASEEGLYEWDIHRDEIFISPRLDRFFHFEVGELGSKGWSWNTRIHPDDAQHYHDALSAHFDREVARWECEYRFRDKQDNYQWILDHGYTVRDEDGKPLRLIGAVRDISKRKAAEAALRKSEERYAFAIEAINEGVYDWDIAKGTVMYSERVSTLLGIPKQELQSPQDWLERIHPEDTEGYERSLAAHFKGESERFECDYRYRAGDGSWRWARQHGLALRDPQGRAYRMIGSTGDTTELKERERELAEKTAILETTLENIDQGITLVDADLRVIAFNRKFLELLDFPPERFKLGYHMEQAFRYNAERGEYGPGDIDQQVRERLALARRFEAHHFERARPDGTVIEIRGTPLPSGLGFVSTYTDITERKRTAEALRESEERYALATRAAVEGIYEWDLATESLYLSDRAREVFEFDDKPLTSAEWNERIHVDDFEGYRRALVDYFRGRTEQLEHEYRISDLHGGHRWLLDRAIGVRNEAGRVVRLLGAISDITARREAEVKLRHAHQELERRNHRLLAEIEAHRQSKATIEFLVEELSAGHSFDEMVGRSPTLKKLFAHLERVATTDSTVLILGESGTGKELVARAIHGRSPRSERPLVKVNCAALPRELVESELFGHEKGAFTGATQQRRGRFELADGGTIFLDEVGDLPPEAQAKLLRVLQEQEFERVGGTATLHCDVRVVAATNRDLAQAVEAGEFRSDLYYRLNVFPVTVPPLRARSEDIPLLANHFLDRAARRLGRKFDGISQAFLDEAIHYHWPGNVRELENVVERAAILSPGPLLELAGPLGHVPAEPSVQSPGAMVISGTLEEVERTYVCKVLTDTSWVIEGDQGAAGVLGLNPSTLRGRMRKLKIKKPA